MILDNLYLGNAQFRAALEDAVVVRGDEARHWAGYYCPACGRLHPASIAGELAREAVSLTFLLYPELRV